MNLKKLSLKALGLLMSVTLVAGVLSSCSKDGSSDKLVESIPSSAMFVVKFNPQQVIENAGCSVDNGKIVLSQKISDAIKGAGGPAALNVANEYLSYTEGINLDAIMMFATNPDASDMAVIATLSDPEPVKKHLKELIGKEKEEDGFTVYKIDRDGVIAIKDKMLWIANKLSVVNKHIENAKESSIASVKEISDVLAADNAFAYVISLPKINSTLKKRGVDVEHELVSDHVPAAIASKIAGVMDYYACGSMTLAGNTVSGEAFLVDEQGNRCQIGKLFNVIDTDFLKNIPAGANCVAACGNIADADVKALVEEAAAELKKEISRNSYDNEELARMVSDLLTKWDGTAAVALDCSYFARADMSSLIGMSEYNMMNTVLENIKFIVMVHYPQSVVNGLADLLVNKANAGNASVRTISPNYYAAPLTPDMSLYFGNLNGYFAMGNFSENSGAMSLADKFSGKRMAIYTHADAIPSLARFGWDFGGESELWLDDDAVKFTAKLTGTNLNYLQAIIEPFTDMDNLQNMISYFNELSRSAYSYDYDFDDDYDYNYDDFAEFEEVAYDDEYMYDI